MKVAFPALIIIAIFGAFTVRHQKKLDLMRTYQSKLEGLAFITDKAHQQIELAKLFNSSEAKKQSQNIQSQILKKKSQGWVISFRNLSPTRISKDFLSDTFSVQWHQLAHIKGKTHSFEKELFYQISYELDDGPNGLVIAHSDFLPWQDLWVDAEIMQKAAKKGRKQAKIFNNHSHDHDHKHF